jgi:hypothetical protein
MAVKHMPQDLFDVAAMTIGLIRLRDKRDVWGEVTRAYLNDYPNDKLYPKQLIDASDQIYELLTNGSSEFTTTHLDVAVGLRMGLDSEMKPVAVTGLKKIFRGTWFSKGHPTPEIRVALCLGSVRVLLTITKSL